jgi:uncharacterized protein YggE
MKFRSIIPMTALLVCAGLGSAKTDETTQRTIRVNGHGRASAPPDVATIRAGVVTQGKSASEATRSNSEMVARLFAVLRELGIADKDIQTAEFSIMPEYRHDPKGQTPPTITGYRVSNQVVVRIRNLPKFGEVLDAVVQAGSNEISGITFGIDNRAGVLNEARAAAIADAKGRAELYAHAASVRVGQVLSITEQAESGPVQPVRFAAMAAERSSDVPIASGETELEVNVTMVFAIDGPI